MDGLSVKLRRSGNSLVGKCPVHGGGRSTEFYLYTSGERSCFNWKCYTEHCDESWRGRCNVIGLCQAILSHDLLNWEKDGDPIISWQETIDRVCEILDVDYYSLEYDEEQARIDHEIKIMNVWAKKEINKARGICHIDKFRKHLEIPSPYFLERGFSEEVLNAYSIGLCKNPKSEMVNRTVIPILDNDKETVIGTLGRSRFPQCPNPDCKLYHPPEWKSCPEMRKPFVKYLVGTKNGFRDKNHLYNYWNSREAIWNTKSMIICESVTDVLKLRMADINNTVALFGSALSDPQQVLIETSGCLSIGVATDNDLSGNKAFDIIKSRCLFQNRIERIKFDGNDLGDLSVDYIKKHIKPQVDKLSKR